MSNELPLVTFGFVNCNRLHYLKSCLESLLETTEDYENKQIIVVDNASVEPGTDEYLDDLRNRGFSVFKQEERDPSNEYAKALNIIAENAEGDYVAPIPADMQFVAKGKWLREYILFFEKYKNNVGCMSFDAQRKVRNNAGSYSYPYGDGEMKFLFHFNRNPIMGAANCLLTREMLSLMYPWEISNESHDGGQDSETKMLHKLQSIVTEGGMKIFYAAPAIPVSVAIFNDEGSSAKVREDKRYGKYIAPEDGTHYYKVHDFDQLMKTYGTRSTPTNIEEIAEAVGWSLPIDDKGEWIKSKDSYSECVDL